VSRPDTILLVGLPHDPPLREVSKALDNLPAPQTFRNILLDPRAIEETSIDLTVGPAIDGLLTIKTETIPLASIRAVYLRPYDARELPAVVRAGEESPLWRRAVEFQGILQSWIELTAALVLNRSSAMSSNCSKPYQCSVIAEFGFLIPETLLTTDPAAVLELRARHPEIIYKSISSVRSIVSRFTDAHLARLELISSCPTQFQQYIPGTDYRVHVVGDRLFACTITTDAVDYRYSHGPVTMQSCDLPPEIALRCLRLAEALQLPLAGIDLRLTPSGAWYCHEVNPAPAFPFFASRAHQPIAESIAGLLAFAS
jgi:hypothetical protein